MHKVGIVGCGFVGSAVAAGFALKADVKVYDKNKSGFHTLREVCGQDIIFLCLPTPMRKSDNLPEMSFIYSALDAITAETTQTPSLLRKIIVIKSTILPGTCRSLQNDYPWFDFISNPEFLTARCARLDFINAARIVVGGNKHNHVPIEKVCALYLDVFPGTPVCMCIWEEAEMVKYMANCFFALKISFCNEMYALCKTIGCDYDFVKQLWIADGRIANSHHEVPGHDGDFGFGGTCFPKDIAAFTQWAKLIGAPIETLDAARKVNDRVRKNKNWEIFNDQEVS